MVDSSQKTVFQNGTISLNCQPIFWGLNSYKFCVEHMDVPFILFEHMDVPFILFYSSGCPFYSFVLNIWMSLLFFGRLSVMAMVKR